MGEELWNPEWCIVGNLLPYPYGEGGPHADFRSQKIFPAGAKLYVLGGFDSETITVVGYAHRRPHPVTAHIKPRYVGDWRAQLIYRPVLLRAFNAAEREESTCHRWRYGYRADRPDGYLPTEPEYGAHLAEIAASFQRRLHGGG